MGRLVFGMMSVEAEALDARQHVWKGAEFSKSES